MYFPMSSKACNILEANMTVLKDDIKPFVRDMVIERTHVKSDSLSRDSPYAVINEDYAWTIPEENSLLGNSSFDDGEDCNS